MGHRIRNSCKPCHIEAVQRRSRQKSRTEGWGRKLQKFIEPVVGSEKARTVVTPQKLRQLLEREGIDIITQRHLHVFPPKSQDDYCNLDKYQIITY